MGTVTKLLAEQHKRPTKFMLELDFVFANLIMSLLADVMLIWIPAPRAVFTAQTQDSKDRGTSWQHTLRQWLRECPDNAFQVWHWLVMTDATTLHVHQDYASQCVNAFLQCCGPTPPSPRYVQTAASSLDSFVPSLTDARSHSVCAAYLMQKLHAPTSISLAELTAMWYAGSPIRQQALDCCPAHCILHQG